MPTIEITEEQAMKLANGDSITVEPAWQGKLVILSFDGGNVFVGRPTSLRRNSVYLSAIAAAPGFVLVAKGPHTAPLGARQVSVGGARGDYTIIEGGL